jgi:ribosome maturation factor RimP
MNREEVLEKLERICTPVLDQLGFRLIEWEYVNEQGRWIIRLFIDREGGVKIADCERASHALEDLIDVELDIKQGYSLEVSSPGINRPLRRPEDFSRFKGSTIKLSTNRPLNGRSNYRGVIEGVTGDTVDMVVDGMRFHIPLNVLKKARLVEEIQAGEAKQ